MTNERQADQSELTAPDMTALEAFLPYADDDAARRWRERAVPILSQSDWYGAEYENLKYQADSIVERVCGSRSQPDAIRAVGELTRLSHLGYHEVPAPSSCSEALFGSVDKTVARLRKFLVGFVGDDLASERQRGVSEDKFWMKYHEEYIAGLEAALAALPAWEARIESVRPLARRLAEIKAAKLKGPRPKPNAKPRKPDYKSSRADHKDVKRMWALLQELTGEVRAKMVPVYVDYYASLVEQYFDLRADDTTGPSKVWKDAYDIEAQAVDGLINSEKTCGHVWYCYNCPKLYLHAEDQEARILAQANRDVDQYCLKFHARMTEKLAPIITAKQNLTALDKVFLDQSSQTVEGRVHAEFADGSNFDIELQVIYNHSKFGRPFVQFPARFGNVRLASGTVLEDISEENVHEVFVKAA